MDPNATLIELRRLVRRHHAGTTTPDDFDRMVELFQALDGWIKGEGFLPDSWEIAQKRAREGKQ